MRGRRWGVALTKQQWIINTLKDFTFPLAHQDPSEAVQQRGADSFSSDQIIAFQNRHLQLSSAWIVAICSSVIVRPSPSSYFPQRRWFDGKMLAVGFFFLRILSFVISPSALFLQQCSGESPFQSDHRSTCSRFNPPSLPTSSSFALTNYKRLARLWMAPKSDIRWKVTLREI